MSSTFRIYCIYFASILALSFTSAVYAQDEHKLSPTLRMRYQTLFETSLAKRSAINSNDTLELILQSEKIDELIKQGFRVRSRIHSIATIEATLEELKTLLQCEDVTYVQESHVERPSELPNTYLTNVKDAHLGILKNQPITGEGVLIAIYDSGIDWRHPDFSANNAVTQSRILFLWDQTDQPDVTHHTPGGYSYGVQYSRNDIVSELKQERTSYVRERDFTGHGTAVAGIAAGNGLLSKGELCGIAPKSDLIIIKGGDDCFSEARIIDGMLYAKRIADSLRKPLVINLSLGSRYGAHNGSRLYELAIDAIAASPGVAVVVAAGNDRENPIHAEGVLHYQGDSISIGMDIPSSIGSFDQSSSSVGIETWYSPDDSVQISIVTPSGKRIQAVTRGNYGFSQTSDGVGFIDNASRGISPLTRLYLASIQLASMGQSKIQPGRWNIIVKNLRSRESGRFHLWLVDSNLRGGTAWFDDKNSQVTRRYLVSSPGNAKEAITVGSIDASLQLGQVSSFSSEGPTLDERQKPEILAAGGGVLTPSPNAEYNGYILRFGTSFAAPQITGLLALAFQLQPQAHSADLKTRLIQSGVGTRPSADGLTFLRSLTGSAYFSPSYLSASISALTSSKNEIQWKKRNSYSLAAVEILAKDAGSSIVRRLGVFSPMVSSIISTDSLTRFTDNFSPSSSRIEYIIRERDSSDRTREYGLLTVPQATTPVEQQFIIPDSLVLDQNYPNPFNSSTTIRYHLPAAGRVVLKIYDSIGREVDTFVDEQKPAGNYSKVWDAKNMASGIYFARLQYGQRVLIQRLIHVK
ncbi:MAG: S8/S53 family peptidase [bacterium]